MRYKIIITCIVLLYILPLSGRSQEEVKSFSLKDCIQYGLANHPSVRVYANNIRKTNQSFRETISEFLPQVSASAGLNDNLKLQQTIIPAGTFGPNSKEQRVAFGTQYNSSFQVQLSQKIYDQSMLLAKTGKVMDKKNARLEQAQNREDLIYNIASSYYRILVSKKQLALLTDNKKRFEKMMKVTKLRAKEGVAKKVDVKQVLVNLNNVLSQISTTKNTLKIATNTLKNNMGLPPSDSVILTDTDRWLDQTPQPTPYPEFDYNSTLQARIQKVQMGLTDLKRRHIKASAIPSLSLVAQYGANGFGQEFSGAFNPLLDYSLIGIKLNWNIFTGLRRSAQYKEATIDLQNAKINYKLNSSALNLQYQNAEAQSSEARATIQTNHENMKLARDVYDNTTLQYRQGIASLTDLLNAELSYREAQSNYIHSLLNFYIADLAVHKANGSLEKYFEQL